MRPTLLYIAPTIPRRSGMGVSMRAGANLLALAESFDVTLVILSSDLQEAEVLQELSEEVRNACRRVIVIYATPRYTKWRRFVRGPNALLLLEALWPLPPSFLAPNAGLPRLARMLKDQEFDAIHCMRLGTSRFLRITKRNGIRYRVAALDMDDYESHAKFRMVRRLGQSMGRAHSLVRWLEAWKWFMLERFLVPAFTRGLACSTFDQALLQDRFPTVEWQVIPNTIAEPPNLARVTTGRFTFTFVGTLDYPPNTDAVNFFCKDVLPRLRKLAPRPFRLLIAGRNPEDAIRALTAQVDIDVIANPPDMAAIYAQTDVALVPIRTGGGTRIKILEAFSYGIAVISTSLGAEGLDVTPGRDVLIADDANGLVEGCLRLMEDTALRAALAEQGHALYASRYDSRQLAALISLAYGGTATMSEKA